MKPLLSLLIFLSCTQLSFAQSSIEKIIEPTNLRQLQQSPELEVQISVEAQNLQVLLPENSDISQLRAQILNSSGILVKSQLIEFPDSHIDISNLPLGLYTLHLRSPKQSSKSSFQVRQTPYK